MLSIKDKPYVMALPPERMISWHQHKLKLFNTRLPMIAANTVFKIAHGNIVVDIHGSADKETLVKAVIAARTELAGMMNEVTDKDIPEFN